MSTKELEDNLIIATSELMKSDIKKCFVVLTSMFQALSEIIIEENGGEKTQELVVEAIGVDARKITIHGVGEKPNSEWVGLTREEVRQAYEDEGIICKYDDFYHIVDKLEEKLKKKNAWGHGNAQVSGNAEVFGSAQVSIGLHPDFVDDSGNAYLPINDQKPPIIQTDFDSGKVFWRGREVETDADFKQAMMEWFNNSRNTETINKSDDNLN